MSPLCEVKVNQLWLFESKRVVAWTENNVQCIQSEILLPHIGVAHVPHFANLESRDRLDEMRTDGKVEP